MEAHRHDDSVKRRQYGFSFLSLLSVLIIFAAAIMLVAKLGPIYFEAYEVGNTLESLKTESKANLRTELDIQTLLLKRFSINDITRVGRQHMHILIGEHTINIAIRYEARVPVIANIDAVVSVEKHVELPT